MLLAVEGGACFTSSASGYSKDLTLLLVQRCEGRPMRVLPWNQYHLVEQEGDPDLQLASRKKRFSRGCTSFNCFRRASAGVDVPPPTKFGLVNQSVTSPDPCISDRGKECTSATAEDRERKIFPKSNLKKQLTRCSSISGEDDHAHNPWKVAESNGSNSTERRKVQWTDSYGKELVEIREFEPSDEDSSDDEFEHEENQRCECVIQ